MTGPEPQLDPVSLESALLHAAPHPARSAAALRWGLLGRMLTAADFAAGCAAGAFAGELLAMGAGRRLGLTLAAGAAWVALCFVCGMSARRELRTWASGVSDAARLLTCGLAMAWILVGLAALSGGAPVLLAAAGGPAAALLGGMARGVARAIVHRLAPLRQRTVIIGSGHVAADVTAALLRHPEVGLEPIGIVDDDVLEVGGPALTRLGGMAELPAILRDHAVDRVIIAFSRAGHDELLQCIRVCRDGGVAIDIVPRLFEFLDGARALDQVGAVPLLSIGVPRLGRGARAAKRALDMAVASALLLALSPLLGAVALAIVLTSRGPVLFRQPRTGRGGAMFHVFKFRSMVSGADARKTALVGQNEHADGQMFKIRRDPRITVVGRAIRRTSIDELPQLLNVLRGDMSLVGPRPLIPEESARLEEDWQSRRLDLRPGITGLWQISGRSDVSFRDMVRLDYQYVSGWSVARDVEILLATVPVVLGGRGAY